MCSQLQGLQALPCLASFSPPAFYSTTGVHRRQQQQQLCAGVRRREQRLSCSAALAIVAAAAAAPEKRLEAQVAVVLGTQWGDEGKGKLVDILAQQYDIVARAQVLSTARLATFGPSITCHG